jgi:hypothetical protein
MTYRITYKGMVVKEFSTVGELDQYLADRIGEWVELSPGHNAHLGKDYLELINDRGTQVTLTFTPPEDRLFVFDDAFAEGHPFK